MRVFLTGGTGLLGSHVASALAASGHEVVALRRASSRTAGVAGVGRWVTGEITDEPARLAALMGGCDAVVHAAALVYGRGATVEDYRRLNVEAVERVLRGAGAAGARRAVAVSSIAVYGSGSPGTGHAEESWRAGQPAGQALYALSKRAGEEAAWRVHEEGLVRLTTVRPGVLYGERDRWFTPILARVAGWPVVPLPGGGGTTVPVVYAGNVARGIVAALELESAAGEAFNLSGDEGLTARALLRTFAGALGRRPRMFPVPRALAMTAATLGDVAGRVIPPGGADLRGAARRMLEDNPYPNEKARRVLGWKSEDLTPAPEALERTARWWRSVHGN